MLYQLLADLPEHQRAALLLREVEEMSYQEIAQVLNISESKVKIDIHRGRLALSKIAKRTVSSEEPRSASGSRRSTG